MAPTLRFYALDRDTDVSGVSGPGRIAYALERDTGVLLVWDTDWITVDWRPSMQVLGQIHGHNGATRIVPLDDDCAAQQKAVELLRQVASPAMATLVSMLDILIPVI